MRTEDNSTGITENLGNLDAYSVTPRRDRDQSSFQRPENTVYQSRGLSPNVVKHVHPAAALGQSIPMAAGQDSQIAPFSASIDDVVERIEMLAETIEEYFRRDASEQVQTTIREWSNDLGIDQSYALAARYAALTLLLKATLYEWYTHRSSLPFLSGDPQNTFHVAADRTSNRAFKDKDSHLTDIVWEIPRDVLIELSWWRHSLLTAENPADDLGYLFEELIPATDRKKTRSV